MEKKDGERVDTVASSAAVSNDPAMAAMATVEEIDRTNHERRKS
jgi:hypothetical protein